MPFPVGSALEARVFDTLVVSHPGKGRIGDVLSSSMMSVVVHGMLIYAAVLATTRVPAVVEPRKTDTTRDGSCWSS
jgi:hypothetical protein